MKSHRTVQADCLQAEYRGHQQGEHRHELVHCLHAPLLGQLTLELQIPGRLPRHARLDIKDHTRRGDDKRE